MLWTLKIRKRKLFMRCAKERMRRLIKKSSNVRMRKQSAKGNVDSRLVRLPRRFSRTPGRSMIAESRKSVRIKRDMIRSLRMISIATRHKGKRSQ